MCIWYFINARHFYSREKLGDANLIIENNGLPLFFTNKVHENWGKAVVKLLIRFCSEFKGDKIFITYFFEQNYRTKKFK